MIKIICIVLLSVVAGIILLAMIDYWMGGDEYDDFIW